MRRSTVLSLPFGKSSLQWWMLPSSGKIRRQYLTNFPTTQPLKRRHDTQHNDTQNNDIQHHDTQHNDA
jgi:hypothetical protein